MPPSSTAAALTWPWVIGVDILAPFTRLELSLFKKYDHKHYSGIAQKKGFSYAFINISRKLEILLKARPLCVLLFVLYWEVGGGKMVGGEIFPWYNYHLF